MLITLSRYWLNWPSVSENRASGVGFVDPEIMTESSVAGCIRVEQLLSGKGQTSAIYWLLN